MRADTGYKPLLKRATLTVAGLLCAALFLGMGSSMLLSDGAPPLMWWFGLTTVAYAAASVALTLAALLRARPAYERTARYLSLAYLLLFAAVSLNAGGLSDMEVLGVVVVAAAATVNWLTVRALTRLAGVLY